MTSAASIAEWMESEIKAHGCLYHDDVVDYLVKRRLDVFLRDNDDGNVVIERSVLDAFRQLTETSVVWVKPDRYWRHRVKEDEPGRDARG